MSFFYDVRERRILPALGIYIGACWVVVEILDRLVDRYFLSPYITDVVFWGLYSLIPAVLLIAWTHGRPGRDEMTRAEKVGVPINLIATLGLLISVFGGKDLSATADLVTVNNELGQMEEHYVPRESYRRRLAVYFFTNESGDPELDWLQYAATELLVQDLQQNPFMVVSSPYENAYFQQMREAGYDNGLDVPQSLMRDIARRANRPYFAEGSIATANSEVVITVRLWDADSLRLLGTFEGDGGDFLTQVDRAANWTKELLDVPAGTGALGGDLALAETYGESEQALKLYVQGRNAVLLDNDRERSNAYYDEAIAIDSGLVLAWLYKSLNQWGQGDAASAQQSLGETQKLIYRLPKRDQQLVKEFAYSMAGEQDKLEKLLRLQVELNQDVTALRKLATMMMLNGRTAESIDLFKQVLERDSSDLGVYLNLARLERSRGNMNEATAYARQFIDAHPENLAGKLLLGDLFLESGEHAQAREQYEDAQLLDDFPINPTLRLALLAARQGQWKEAREQIEEARALSTTAFHASNILAVESLLALRLGRIEHAMALTMELFEVNRLTLPPVQQVFMYYVPLTQYNLLLGRLDEATRLVETAQQEIQPPLNQFLSFIEVTLRARRGEFEAAEAALKEGSDAINRYDAEYLAFQIPYNAAEIARQKREYARAAALYEEAVIKANASPIGQDAGNQMSMIYGACAQMHVLAGELELAQIVLDRAFERDEAEPTLWVAKAMLQEANGNPQMALASVDYALAIWSGADPDYTEYRDAQAMRQQLVQLLP